MNQTTPMPNELETGLELIKLKLSQQEFDQALKAITPLLERYGENAYLHHLAGVIWTNLGQLAQALNYFLKSFALEPTNKVNALALITGLLHCREFNLAAKITTVLRQLYPNDGDVLNKVLELQDLTVKTLVPRLHLLLEMALKGKKLKVDTLQYHLMGGLAFDARMLPVIKQAGYLDDAVFFSGKPANQQLVKMISRCVPVFQDSSFGTELHVNFDWVERKYTLKQQEFKEKFFTPAFANAFDDLVEFYHSTNGSTYFDPSAGERIYNLSARVQFTAEEEMQGAKILQEQLGIPAPAWFVCIYARDAGYFQETTQSVKFFRNADIDSYAEAAKEIVKKGGYVVRVGSAVNKPFSLVHPQVVDYASRYSSDFMDIYLLAKCRFFMGSPSGLVQVTDLFKTPCLNTDTICLNGFRGIIYLPKKICWAANGAKVPFGKVIEALYGTPEAASLFEDGPGQKEKLGFIHQDNSPEELAEATVEMIERLEGKFFLTEEDQKLHQRFEKLWERRRYGPKGVAAIATTFLRRYRDLVD